MTSRPRSVPGAAEAALAFAQAVLFDGGELVPCAMCGDRSHAHEAHHMVPKRRLWEICRYVLRIPDVEALALIYAPAIGVPLCDETAPRRCHPRHTHGGATVPRSRLPTERVYAWIADLGDPAAIREATAAFEREHPDVDVPDDDDEEDRG